MQAPRWVLCVSKLPYQWRLRHRLQGGMALTRSLEGPPCLAVCPHQHAWCPLSEQPFFCPEPPISLGARAWPPSCSPPWTRVIWDLAGSRAGTQWAAVDELVDPWAERGRGTPSQNGSKEGGCWEVGEAGAPGVGISCELDGMSSDGDKDGAHRLVGDSTGALLTREPHTTARAPP